MTEQLITSGDLPSQRFSGDIRTNMLVASLAMSGNVIAIPGPGNDHPDLMTQQGLHAVMELDLQPELNGRQHHMHAYWTNPATQPDLFPFEEEVRAITHDDGRQPGFLLVSSVTEKTSPDHEITGRTFVPMNMPHGVFGAYCNMSWIKPDRTPFESEAVKAHFGLTQRSEAPDLVFGQKSGHLIIEQRTFGHPVTIRTRPTEVHKLVLRHAEIAQQKANREQRHSVKTIGRLLRTTRISAGLYALPDLKS